MPSYQNIILDEKDGVAVLTLNNPENRNPLTEETKSELISALDDVKNRSSVRVLVIAAKGSAFCAGGDVKKVGQKMTHEDIRAVMQKSQQLLLRIVNLEKPVIAAVNGDAFGMGCNLVLAADFAIASEKARFCEVFVKLGIIPDFGALYFLPRLVGLARAKEMTYLGNVIDADAAGKMGLVYQVVSHEELETASMELAGRLARMPTLAIGKAKSVLNRTFDLTLSQVLDEEVAAQIFLSHTRDYQEGMQAFKEKRKPDFKGK
ncbi:MAG: enoyl-CoA hydratase/isomerase family protein [Desulfobacterales bacterium]|nr:enoyl-CoA hydratase/isomerase family protein [Desulfobacterales bacterium]